MIRHIIALIAVVLAGWAVLYMARLDSEVHKFQRIRELIQSTAMEDKKIHVQRHTGATPVASPAPAAKTSQRDKEVEAKLKALKEKAGNIAAFKVSPLYKKSCSSCHGVTGEGIIGPKLRGKSKEEILQALHDFKSGKRKNYVMYGLLGNMNEQQLEQLATEIATFQAKFEAATK